MRTIRYSLAWKEWHEHKWKLVSITAILWSVAALLIVLGVLDRDVLVAMHVAITFSIVPIAVFVGAGAAAGEQSHRTMPFLQALPVPMWQVALHKIVYGLLTIIVPILLTVAVIPVCCQVADMYGLNLRAGLGMRVRPDEQFLSSNWFAVAALTASVAAGSVFLWTTAFGANRNDEVSAGAAALVVILAVWLLLTMFWNVLLLRSTEIETARLRAIGISIAPAGVISLPSWANHQVGAILMGLFTAVVVHALLGARYVRRFGHGENVEIRSPRGAASESLPMESLPPPRRWPLTAMVWKQRRESGPIALTGVIGVVGIFVLFAVVEWNALFSQSPDRWAYLTEVFAVIAVAFGFGIALVAGIGVFFYDLRPSSNAFWRSRPINPHLWFWTRFVVALLIVLAVIYLPLALATGIRRSSGVLTSRESYMQILAAHIAVFSAAVAVTCLVRQAVYAAILSIAFLYLGMVSVWLAVLMGRRMGWIAAAPDHPVDLTEPQLAVAMLINFLAATLLAWLAVRYDWGRKSRY